MIIVKSSEDTFQYGAYVVVCAYKFLIMCPFDRIYHLIATVWSDKSDVRCEEQKSSGQCVYILVSYHNY